MTLVPEIKRWDQKAFELGTEPVPSWFFDTLAKLRGAVEKDGNKRVSLGLAFDSYNMPSAEIATFFERARNSGAGLITSHWRRLDAKGEHLNSMYAAQLTCVILSSGYFSSGHLEPTSSS